MPSNIMTIEKECNAIDSNNLTKDLQINIGDDQIQDTNRNKIKALIMAYLEVFENRPGNLVLDIEHDIDLKKEEVRIKGPVYKRHPKEHDLIKNEVKNLLEKDIIEKCYSEYTSPVVLVRKPNNEWRFCMDYRELNAVTIKKLYPIPNMDEAIECLQGSNYFTVMGLESGYHQIRIKECDQEKTAFLTRKVFLNSSVCLLG